MNHWMRSFLGEAHANMLWITGVAVLSLWSISQHIHNHTRIMKFTFGSTLRRGQTLPLPVHSLLTGVPLMENAFSKSTLIWPARSYFILDSLNTWRQLHAHRVTTATLHPPSSQCGKQLLTAVQADLLMRYFIWGMLSYLVNSSTTPSAPLSCVATWPYCLMRELWLHWKANIYW